MTNLVNRAAVAVLAVLAPVLLLIFRVTYGNRVPDPLPTHWNLAGRVNGTAGAGTFFVILLVIGVLLGVVVLLLVRSSRRSPTGRAAIAALLFGGWLCAALYGTTVAMSAGASSAAQVGLSWPGVVVIVLIPLLAAIAGWLLLPVPASPAVAVPAESALTFSDTERVVWTGRAESRLLRWIAAAGLVASGLLAPFTVPAALIVFVVSLALVFVTEIGVRVDAVGLHTLWGPFGWPRGTVRLAEIEAATALQVEPMEWGGWGYRITPRGRAAVIRRGPGILLDRVGSPRYLVTVDQAAAGADVVNALLDRARRHH